MPACPRVSTLVAIVTLSNPESHLHFSLVDVITVTFNMAVTEQIFVLAGFHVERPVNGARRAALDAIECEIPTTAAAVTVSNPEVTSKVNMDDSVCEVLHKFTVLENNKSSSSISVKLKKSLPTAMERKTSKTVLK